MLNPFSNPSYLLPPLVGLIVSLILFSIVLRGTMRSVSKWLFCLLLLDVGLWNFLTFIMRSSPDVHRALVWDRVLPVAGYIIVLLYYHFTLTYTNTKGQRNILIASYIFIAVIASLAPTGLIIKGMRLEDYGYAPITGPFVFFLSICATSLMVGGGYNLLRRYKASHSYEERNRLIYLIIALLFPFVGGLLDTFSNLPPAAIWGYLIFCILCSVAILRYHLLDIRVVVRKGLVYIIVSSMIAIPYVVILYLLHFIFKPMLEPWWIHAIIILLLAIILRPLYSHAQKFVDRLFYRDRYDYLKALEQFSQETQSIVNLKELSSTLTGLVSGALHTSSACLLLPSESDNGLIVLSSTGLSSPPSGVVLRHRSPLIKCLKLQQRILSSKEFDIVPQLQSLSLREKNNLKQMEAKLYVPIQAEPGQLSGILVLGQKLSQQPYSSEDRQLLKALSSQMAIALENARLYNESQHEIGERKQAEEALQAEKNKLQSVIGAIEYALTIQDKEYNIIYQNEPSRISSSGSRIGEKCYRVYEGRDSICDACPVEKAFKDGKSHTTERQRLLPSGDFTFWENTANPIRDASGNIVSCLEIGRNITERKQAEEREKEMQRELLLSSRLASIGELAAGVAHQLNNPLTGILGFSQRILRKVTDQETSQDLKKIYGEAERAAKIVQNLLTFARRRQPKKEYSDVNNVVRNALELRAYELKTSNIEVTIKLAPSLPKIMLDFHQMQEVFLNLILNAEQAMTEANGGGKLIIKTEKNKEYVRCTFSDDGPGIPAERLDNIFDPFFTTKGERGGTGLGLSVCHGIIGEHGGKIYAKSKPRKGATFFVELPITTKE